MKQRSRLLTWIPFLPLLYPTLAFADGGGPLLLIINVYLFSFGQIWIVLSEFFYLRRCLKEVGAAETLGWVVVINIASTICGALLLPLLWSLLFLMLSFLGPWQSVGGVFAALGTWVVGDNSPHVWLAFLASAVLFVLTYFLTVWIEYRLLLNWGQRSTLPPPAELHRIAYRMNAISYAGLVLLFIAGVLVSKGHG